MQTQMLTQQVEEVPRKKNRGGITPQGSRFGFTYVTKDELDRIDPKYIERAREMIKKIEGDKIEGSCTVKKARC